jgi:hypothetical protein
MTVFNPRESNKKPRADMYLPVWLNVFGFILDAGAVALLVIAIRTAEWPLLLVTAAAGGLGIAAHMCWKNQTVRILDENTFEYTTFTGKTTRYSFSEIEDLRWNTDSMTLFVGSGKVHIESIAFVSKELSDKIGQVLASKGRQPHF